MVSTKLVTLIAAVSSLLFCGVNSQKRITAQPSHSVDHPFGKLTKEDFIRLGRILLSQRGLGSDGYLTAVRKFKQAPAGGSENEDMSSAANFISAIHKMRGVSQPPVIEDMGFLRIGR